MVVTIARQGEFLFLYFKKLETAGHVKNIGKQHRWKVRWWLALGQFPTHTTNNNKLAIDDGDDD